MLVSWRDNRATVFDQEWLLHLVLLRPGTVLATGVLPTHAGVRWAQEVFECGEDPRKSEANMSSSIIHLVCPHRGRSMMEFQCKGKCRRNCCSTLIGIRRYGHSLSDVRT